MKKIYLLYVSLLSFSFCMNAQLATHVVLSEVYGGGGNSSATYKNDFIELYNPTSSPVSLTGWSVQYASATGTTWQATNLSGSIPAYGFFLIQEASGGSTGSNLPTPDVTGTINMSATAGKVILCNVTTVQSGANPTGAQIIDKIGYGSTANAFEGAGTAPAPSNSSSDERKATGTSTASSLTTGGADVNNGNGWDSDNNNSDFVAQSASNPQNTTSPTEIPPTNLATISAGSNASEPSTNGSFTINLNFPAPAGGVTVTYGFAGTATNNVDYSDPNNGTITIPQGNSSATININVIDDNVAEPTETITAFLTSASNGYAASATSATINLADNESTQLASYTFSSCTSFLSDGFTQFNVTGTEVWSCTTFGKIGNAVQMNGNTSGINHDNQDWLISPSLNLSSTNIPELSFYCRTKFAGDQLKLLVSTNYVSGDPTAGGVTWTEIDGRFPLMFSDAWKLSQNINLSAFKASNVHFAFKYTSSTNAASRITLDEISVIDASVAPSPVLTINTFLQDFRYVAFGSSSANKSFTLWANDLTTNLTLTAPSNFQLSKDGSSFSNSISYTPAEAQNNLLTVYARLTPSANSQVSAGNISFASTGINQQNVLLKGNSYSSTTTLDVVNWNLEWFGSPAQNPADDNLQQANVQTVLQYLGADIYAVEEVVDISRLTTVVNNMPGYAFVVSDYCSLAPDPSDPDYASGQKLALIYKTSEISNLTARGLLKTSLNPNASSNWASGRFPYLVTATVTKNGTSKDISFIVIHGKSGSTQSDYDRRKAGTAEMKDTLDAFFSTKNIIVLGDYNDDLDESIFNDNGSVVSSYDDLIKDSTDADSYSSVTMLLSNAKLHSTFGNGDVIDHAVISNEMVPIYIPYSATLYDDIATLTGIANYNTTTTDHYPVMTRYQFAAASPLPVTLTNFTAIKQNNVTHLSWSTAQELNSKEFVIERSIDGINFTNIGIVQAAGNSSLFRNYGYDDIHPVTGINFYRLKSVDKDGHFTYSNIVKVVFEKQITISIRPNPATDHIEILSNQNTYATIELRDLAGKLMNKKNIILTSGQPTRVSLDGLSKGVYLLSLISDDFARTEKIIIQ